MAPKNNKSNKPVPKREAQHRMPANDQRILVVCLSAILPLLLACVQLHGVLLVLLMKQQNKLQLAYRQLLSEWNNNNKKIRALKKLKIRRKRCRWTNPGRTDKWWQNMLNGKLKDEEWQQNFRMTRPQFMELADCVRPSLEPEPSSFRPDALSVEKKLAATLYYLKDQGSYRMTCNSFGISLPCLSKTVRSVCSAINTALGPEILRLPRDTNEMTNLISMFENRFGFPQAFGCLDGTHIPIRQPIENNQDYFCYKMKYSLNVQALCDYRGIFRDVAIMWPGSVHDSCVFANSKLNKQLTEKTLPIVYRTLIPGTERIPPLILGDPAYPLLPNVMKEYGENAINEKAIFNQILRGGRNQIECAFGRLKARWQILNRPMNLKQEDLPTIIYSCFVLHNFCELRGNQLTQEDCEQQLQVNAADRCCTHHNQPDRLHTYNTSTGMYFREIITDYFNECWTN